MPLARHDKIAQRQRARNLVSTHMPLARHDTICYKSRIRPGVSTHMPLARHDEFEIYDDVQNMRFYSHASCEA